MTMQMDKPQKVQILLSYSEQRKLEMKQSHEVSCQALADAVRSAIEKEAHGKVTRVTPLIRGFADLLIEGTVTDHEALKRLQMAMEKINRSIGAEKVYLSAKDV